MSAVVPFFQWCDDSMIGVAIRDSGVAFPIVENFQLFALTVLLGKLVVLCLRQFGLVLKKQTIGDVAAQLKPWNRWGMAVILAVESPPGSRFFCGSESALPVALSVSSDKGTSPRK